ncbi:MAG TPA: hypothetical protein VMR52_11715 [Dehalococcoidia bacterium]|nr:hypothetical protein [Dehalococcoidia bacterium]
MTDDERAEMLARAIDELIRGIEEPEASHGLEDEELDALLEVARDRLESGRAAQQEAASYEADIWNELKGRLSPGQPSPLDIDLPRDQHDALSDIIALRMRMAREVLDLAESHRDEVWARLESRLATGLGGAPPPSADGVPIDGASEAEVEAITRRSLARLAEIASDPLHIRFKERLKRDVSAATHHIEPAPPSRTLSPLLLISTAILILVVAIIGLVALTGLDDIPALQVAGSLVGGSPDGAGTPP